MRKLLLIMVLNICLLFSPQPKTGTTDPNGRYISLNSYAGFFLNPDTYGFIFPAIHPSLLFENRALRQSRPLYILAGSALGRSITFLSWPLHQQLFRFYGKFWRGTYPRENILLIGNFYLGYFFLNILILWTALFLFEKIFNILVRRTERSQFCAYLLKVFIASNPITKAFFWTVHQQMFAMLTPLLCIYILFRLCQPERVDSLLHMAGFFFIAGLLLLMYGNFLLMLPALLYCFLYQKIKTVRSGFGTTIFLRCVLLIILFFIPTICWISILRLKGVVYYSFEVNYYHQLIWIPETLNRSFSQFIRQFLSNSFHYILTMKQLLILSVFSIILLGSGKIYISRTENFFVSILFVLLSFFLFYWLLGFYEERLTDTLIPLIICFWVVMIRQKIVTARYIYLLSSLALTWQMYVLFSYGPFS
jgi:hypothetical protein